MNDNNFPARLQVIQNEVTLAENFSVIEALYARGFTSASRITQISGNDFQQALTGTVAYDLASAIYGSATAIAPAESAVSAPPGEGRGESSDSPRQTRPWPRSASHM